jgi:putative ABC transport system permease protein
MVEGFRRTFVAWLDQRLVAEVYYEAATPADARTIEAWARTQPDVSAILPVWRAKTRIGGWPVEIMGMTPHETYTAHFPLGDVAPDVWSRLHTSDAALVSEQLARRLGLAPGDSFDIPTSGEDWRVSVAGIFPDYGNPKGQLRIDHARLAAHFDDASGVHYSLRVTPGTTAQVMTALQARFGDKIARIVDQAEVRKLSTDIFERTFAVTTALNALTLGVSAVALFTSLLTLSNMRLARIAPVWAIGVTRRRLAGLELLRILLFAGGAALLAIPLGVFVTWGLVAVVNVAAFGWRLPMYVFPMDWILVFVIALATAAIAGAAPVVRLARSAPVDLLRAFADER